MFQRTFSSTPISKTFKIPSSNLGTDPSFLDPVLSISILHDNMICRVNKKKSFYYRFRTRLCQIILPILNQITYQSSYVSVHNVGCMAPVLLILFHSDRNDGKIPFQQVNQNGITPLFHLGTNSGSFRCVPAVLENTGRNYGFGRNEFHVKKN